MVPTPDPTQNRTISRISQAAQELQKATQHVKLEAELGQKLGALGETLQCMGIALGIDGKFQPGLLHGFLIDLNLTLLQIQAQQGPTAATHNPVASLAAEHLRRLPLEDRANFILELLEATDGQTNIQHGEQAAHDCMAEVVAEVCKRYKWGGWAK